MSIPSHNFAKAKLKKSLSFFCTRKMNYCCVRALSDAIEELRLEEPSTDDVSLFSAPGVDGRRELSVEDRVTVARGSAVMGPTTRRHWDVERHSNDPLFSGCGCRWLIARIFPCTEHIPLVSPHHWGFFGQWHALWPSSPQKKQFTAPGMVLAACCSCDPY